MALRLNTSHKAHLTVGIVTGIWLVSFLILIAPFDTSDLSFKLRCFLLPPYGILFVMSYFIVTLVQNKIYEKRKRWTLTLEVGVIFLTFIITFPFIYLYYKSAIINGTYEFSRFTVEVFLPILAIISTIFIAARWYISSKSFLDPEQANRKLVLRGDNREDVLQVDQSQLTFIASAQNYVEVHYQHNGKTHKKLLRSTLKKINAQVPELLKTHRSYLINPDHFIRWVDASNIMVDEQIIPVSKNFKKDVETKINSIPKS